MEIWLVPTKTAAYTRLVLQAFAEVCAGMQPSSLPKEGTPAALAALQPPKEDQQAFPSSVSQMSSLGFC